jgi:hypothetical protein
MLTDEDEVGAVTPSLVRDVAPEGDDGGSKRIVVGLAPADND